MAFVQTNGIQTFVTEDGHGPPVVFVHGHSLDHRMWEPQIDVVTAAGYRAIRYDVRGHGRSDAPPGGYDTEDLAIDLRALLDALAVDRAHVAGLSRGGSIALALAVDAPERVRSLTLIDAVLPGGPLSPDTLAGLNAVAEAYREHERAAFTGPWLASAVFDGVRRDPDLLARVRAMVELYSGAEFAPLRGAPEPPHIERQPLIERLGEVRAPALVLVGELDHTDFREYARLLGDGIAGARAAVVPDAGHIANMEQPAAVNRLLLEFWQSVG